MTLDILKLYTLCGLIGFAACIGIAEARFLMSYHHSPISLIGEYDPGRRPDLPVPAGVNPTFALKGGEND